MSLIDEALSANATIAEHYDPSRGKPPAPKIAIVTCADPRLTDIEQMLGLSHADVDMIRNFGTVIDDDAIRSLVLSTRLLDTREIMIINHTDCGMLRFTDDELENKLRRETGRSPSRRRSSTASPTPRRTPRSRSRRPGHIRGSPRRFPSAGSSTTSVRGVSAKSSPTWRPSMRCAATSECRNDVQGSRLRPAVDPFRQQVDLRRGPRSVARHGAASHPVENRGLVGEHVLARPEVERLQHRCSVFVSEKRADITLKADNGLDHQ
jgi:hypothetical protein